MERVILLNSDYSFLNTINWKKAMRLLAKGKVEVLKATEKILQSADRTWELYIPKVIRLVKLVRSVYKTRVPYSKKNVIYRDKYTCQYCGIKEKKMTIDHVVPSSKGGKSSFENCVASCKACNSRKGNRLCTQIKMFPKVKAYQPTISEFLSMKLRNLGIDQTLKDLGVF